MSHEARVHWIFPAVGSNSGGHRTAIRYANALVRAGLTVSGEFLPRFGVPTNSLRLARDLERWYGRIDFTVVESPKPAPWLVVATGADTVAPALALAERSRVIYFVQDYEPHFFPQGYLAESARQSYGAVEHVVTLGKWLSVHLAAYHDRRCGTVKFGVDGAHYSARLGQRRTQRICFVHQPQKPRRCAELGLQALELIAAARPDAEIVLFGSNERAECRFAHENLGQLSDTDCAKLYRGSAVGLCLSATNPSRIPFEMLACGLPVVEFEGINTQLDLSLPGISCARPVPESIAAAVLDILEQPTLHNAAAAKGARIMDTRGLASEEQHFVVYIQSRLSDITKLPLPAAPPSGPEGTGGERVARWTGPELMWELRLRAKAVLKAVFGHVR